MAWMHALLEEMVTQGCSDLHMSSANQPMFRLGGEMVPVEGTVEITPAQMVTVLREITTDEHWEDFERDWDKDFAYALEGCGRFRVNLFYDYKGPGAVLRLIPEKIPSAAELGLPPVV